jgi:hypothetical protein
MESNLNETEQLSGLFNSGNSFSFEYYSADSTRIKFEMKGEKYPALYEAGSPDNPLITGIIKNDVPKIETNILYAEVVEFKMNNFPLKDELKKHGLKILIFQKRQEINAELLMMVVRQGYPINALSPAFTLNELTMDKLKNYLEKSVQLNFAREDIHSIPEDHDLYQSSFWHFLNEED